MKTFSFKATSLMLASCYAIPALASQNTPISQTSPIVVTASRTVQTANESLTSVSVISREDIESSHAATLSGILSQTPGLSVTNSGGLGKSSSVFLRGTNSSHVLILVDGIRMGSATSGTFSFQDFPINQIDHIEIVRGPRSSIYGSDAIGGVIQIFTKKGSVESKPYAKVSLGAESTRNISAGVSGEHNNINYSLNADHTRSDGFNARTSGSDDDDGYRNNSVSGSFGTSNENMEFGFQALFTDSQNDFDGFTNSSDTKQSIINTRVKLFLNDYWDLSFNLGVSNDDFDDYFNGTYSSTFDTQKNNFSLQNNFTLGEEQLLIVGFDFLEDEISGTTTYAESERSNRAVFAQYIGQFDQLDFELSLRNDNNEAFGSHQTGSIALGYSLTPTVKVFSSAGTGFKAPTFNELYFPNYGNADLKPEESKSYEIGIKGVNNGHSWAASAFHTRINNLITSVNLGIDINGDGWPDYQAQATDKAVISGLELSYSLDAKTWHFDTNITLLNHKNKSDGANDGNELARRPKAVYNASLSKALSRWTLGGKLRAESDRYNNATNTNELGGFVVLDLVAGYELDKDWSASWMIENVLNQQYQTVASYNQPDWGATFTLAYQPK